MPPTQLETSVSSRSRALLFAALVIGIGLRVWDAWGSSLWLDELHSLAHASQPNVAGVLEHTHWDFHAPLFFLAVHFAWTWTSASPEALRLIPLVSSLLVVFPLLVLARRSRLGPWAPALSVALFAFLPFQIQYARELRPYAWLMLASAVACQAAFTEAGSKQLRFVLFAAAVAFGLLTHYLMAMVVLVIGLVRLVFLLPALRARFTSRGPLLGFGWLILAGAIGACAFLPWLFNRMDWVVHTPQELVPPDAAERTLTEANRTDLLQAPLKTLVPRIGALGSPWTSLAMAGAAMLAAALLLAGVLWLVRAGKRDLPPADRSTALAIAFALLSVPLVPVMSILLWGRVSIQYLCIAAWLWPLVMCELLAAVRSVRLRTALAALMVVGALVAGVGHAGGAPREDVKGAVAKAREIGLNLEALDPAHPPFYTALLSQPPRFEHCTPYLAYAPGLACVELKDAIHAGLKPPLLPRPGEPGFDRPAIVITRRYLDLDTQAALDKATREGMPEILRLRTGRTRTQRVRIDETMTVWVFGPGPR